jgi:hypothetical protein
MAAPAYTRRLLSTKLSAGQSGTIPAVPGYEQILRDVEVHSETVPCTISGHTQAGVYAFQIYIPGGGSSASQQWKGRLAIPDGETFGLQCTQGAGHVVATGYVLSTAG